MTTQHYHIQNGLLVGYTGNEENIVIPQEVSAIDRMVFFSRDNIRTVIIHGSVKTIGNGAFFNCTGLRTAIIGCGVEVIEDFAFRGCTSLKTVELPDSVKEVQPMAFDEKTEVIRNVGDSSPAALTEETITPNYPAISKENVFSEPLKAKSFDYMKAYDNIDFNIQYQGMSFKIEDIIYCIIRRKPKANQIDVFINLNDNIVYSVTDGETEAIDLFQVEPDPIRECGNITGDVNVYVVFHGSSLNVRELLDYLKNDILDYPNQYITVFLKPEESKAFYVVEGIANVIDVSFD